MKFCNTCYKTVTDNKIKIGDECPELGCFGKITEEEDIMVPLYIKLRKKNYHPYGFISGEDGKDDFYIIVDNIQAREHLPPLPKDIEVFQYLTPPPKNEIFEQIKMFGLKRKLHSKVKSKRQKEIQKAAKDFETYIDTFPTLLKLYSEFNCYSTLEADELYNLLLLYRYGFDLFLEEDPNPIVSVSRIIKESERKKEVEFLYELYDKMGVERVTYGLYTD
jgi:hypothetical protein